jgi:D-glycero-D-manno-heptose 1,7-bisphosphate phosphatase
MNAAVFLDRDGVIIQNRENYVRSWKDVEFLPSSLDALILLSQTSYKIIIITNQSAIGRGIITIEQAEAINQRIIREIFDVGGRVDGLFICPHVPEDHCLCRKPLPGLILQAAESLSIDLSLSALIGDALTDIQAGIAAGILSLFLVKTGRGQEQHQSPQTITFPQLLITDHLLSAINIILYKSTSKAHDL